VRPAGAARPRRRCDRERGPLASLRPAGDDGQAGLSFDLYLARHGETEWSLSGRHTGSTDLALTSRGEERARALASRFHGIHFDAVYSSPMQRARRTAELAGFPHPDITDLLREVDYGRYEGLTTAQIRESDPGWELYRDGCPGGETPAQVYARAQAFIDLATGAGAQRALAFAHGHILRAVAVAWIGAGIEVAAGLYLDVATLSILRADNGGHGRVIALWNAA
jgi:probable phosphoglycerate mutase